MQKRIVLSVFSILGGIGLILPIFVTNSNRAVAVKAASSEVTGGYNDIDPYTLTRVHTKKTFADWKHEIENLENIDKTLKKLYISYDGLNKETIESITVTKDNVLTRTPDGTLLKVSIEIKLKDRHRFINTETPGYFWHTIFLYAEMARRIPVPNVAEKSFTEIIDAEEWKRLSIYRESYDELIRNIFGRRLPWNSVDLLFVDIVEQKERSAIIDFGILLRPGYVFDNKEKSNMHRVTAELFTKCDLDYVIWGKCVEWNQEKIWGPQFKNKDKSSTKDTILNQ